MNEDQGITPKKPKLELTSDQMVINILAITIVGLIIITIAVALAGDNYTVVWPLTASILFSAGAIILVRRGNSLVGKFILPSLLLLIITFIAYNRGGLYHISVAAYPVVIVLAGLLLGIRGSFIFATLSSLSAIGLGLADILGTNPNSITNQTGYDDLVVVTALFFIVSGIFRVIIQRLTESIQEAETNAQAQEIANYQLQELQKGLEQQVADRTRALETSTEVSRQLSTILDQEQLVREVVEQLRNAFGYYHAHIYLYDEARQVLEMAGGTGDAGRAMLARGHKIEPGTGLVGRAAKANEILLIPDVLQAEGWLPNPLLPETKAEVAVPIAIGSDVLGVLDVQHNVRDGLTQQDADLIQAIANQVAIAVQNAQEYTRTQKQARRESQIAEISQRIQSATTIDDVLKVAVSELGQALETQRASVELKVGSQPNHGRDERY